MKDDKLYFRHIIDASIKIEKFIENLSYKDFVLDDRTHLAVIRLLEIIGEAANHISNVTTNSIKDVPWKDIVGLRNILIHDYFNVDLEIVWKTINENIPEIKSKMQNYLSI